MGDKEDGMNGRRENSVVWQVLVIGAVILLCLRVIA